MSNGHQRYLCPVCRKTFIESFESIYYRRQVKREQIHQVLQAHSEGSSLRGVSRTTQLAYNTVVSILRAASHKAQLIQNQEVQAVKTEAVSADEMWSFVSKSGARRRGLLACRVRQDNRGNVPKPNEPRETVGSVSL